MESTQPFPTGKSPFRVKGVVYRGHLAYVAEHVPGGNQAVLAALPETGYAEFFEQPFLAGTWYDVFPLVLTGGICARLCGMSYHSFLQVRTAHQVELDLSGVYRHLARFATGGMIIRGVNEALRRYYDFADTRITKHPRGLTASITGVPLAIADWFRICLTAYFKEAIKLAGKDAVSVRSTLGTWRGTRHAVPLVEVVFDVEWPA